MSQSLTLDKIKEHPGIYQRNLPKELNMSNTSVHSAVKKLLKWNQIERIKKGATFALFSKV